MTKLASSFLVVLLLATLTGCAGMICKAPAEGSLPAALSPETAIVASDLPLIRSADRRNGQPYKPFATYGQCQIGLSYAMDPASGLPVVGDGDRLKVESCLSLAAEEKVDVLILPELALGFKEPTRKAVMEAIRTEARERGMVVIAGSFYDASRHSRLPVIGPAWMELGYKLKPSRFEASPRYGLGMKEGRELLLLDTPFGRIVPLTCVDLISDSIQYSVRNLATRGQVDVIANLNFNPAAWEFMIEANGIARRHPVVVSITNVSGDSDPKTAADCRRKGDNGYCFGNSALFAGLRGRSTDCPNCVQAVADLVEPVFKTSGDRSLAYDTLVAVVPPFEEGMLIYDVNLRLLREPAATNAPDQGYPVVRNVRRVPVKNREGSGLP